MTMERRWPAPWAFGVLILPLAISFGFRMTSLPFLLATAGVPVNQIANVASILWVPATFAFFWAPAVDVKLRRRTWLVVGAVGTALGLCAALPLIGTTHLKLLTAVVFATTAIADTVVMASGGGLMVTMLDANAQSHASAWQQAGQLGGGALGGAVVIWLAGRVPMWAVGPLIAPVIVLPGLVALTIAEPRPGMSAWFRGRVGKIIREIWALVRAPQRRWGTLLLLSPTGTGAAAALLPAIASYYGVGAAGVMWVNGAAGGAMLALGALCGTLLPGDWDRRLTYAGAGLTNALAAIVLITANRPSIYLAGTILYLLTNGLAWARFTALMVEIIGKDTRDASTFFTALAAVGSVPVLFMTWLDGVGFHKFGTRGLLWMDAAPNILIFAIVASVFVARGMSLRTVPQPAVLQADIPTE